MSDRLIQSLKDDRKNFEFIDEGYVKRHIGVDITKWKDGSIEVTQPHLIGRFIALVDQEQNINSKITPATKPLLHKDAYGLEIKHS